MQEFVNDYLSKNLPLFNKNDQIIIYNDGSIKVDVTISPLEETAWMNQSQIATLYETTISNVSMHISNIILDKELDDSVIKDFLNTAQDGKNYKVTFYNLDMILAIGYRVKSATAIRFRKWVSIVLKDFIIKGIAYNEPRCVTCYKSEEISLIQQEILKLKEGQYHEITYFGGEQLRGFIEIKRFLETAKREIIIIDNYLGHSFDEILSNLNVEKLIITDPQNKKISSNKNYDVLKKKAFHDRYIMVDDVCYHFGSSFEDLGNKISTGNRIREELLINEIKKSKNEFKNEKEVIMLHN